MQRVPEPELMDDDAQARAYAEADFEEPNQALLDHFAARFPDFEPRGYVLDLGCGPGDITLRFARAYPGCVVHGVDGSPAMLRLAEQALLRDPELDGCVEFLLERLPGLDLPQANYDAVISNSLLHHLHEPAGLWQTIVEAAAPEAPVLVMDLIRPDSDAEVADFIARYAADAPEVLRRDFGRSLRAAFTLEEVRGQLEAAGLGQWRVEQVSDRHLLVSGRMMS